MLKCKICKKVLENVDFAVCTVCGEPLCFGHCKRENFNGGCGGHASDVEFVCSQPCCGEAEVDDGRKTSSPDQDA